MLLTGDQDLLIARGIRATLPSSTAALSDRIAAFWQTADPTGPDLLVGALPFDKRRPAHLIHPETVTRLDRTAGLLALREEYHPVDLPAGQWQVREEPSRSEYVAQVSEVLRHLEGDGDTTPALRKVVLARTLHLSASDGTIDPVRLFLRLATDPLVQAYAVALPTVPATTFVGATPELLLDKQGERIATCPLAGSTPRRADPAVDADAGARLLTSDKDRREHATVVEWVADRLAPLCRTLTVPSAPDLLRTATMWHLGTPIHGTLKDAEQHVVDITARLHPTPAIAGVPLEEASRLMEELEPFDRGYFAGAVGWCTRAGDGRWLLAIRCATIAPRTARLFAGAGIVAGSDPEHEADETGAKFRAMLDALGVESPCRPLVTEGVA